MEDPGLLADVVRWIMGVPADQVTWKHALFLTVAGVVWNGPSLLRLLYQHKFMRFAKDATPEQLAAYTGKMPPPKPPGVTGPVVMFAVLCLLALSGRHSEQIATTADPNLSELVPSTGVKKCCKECDAPSYCRNCKCEAATAKPPRVSPQRDERFTSAPVPPLQSWRVDELPSDRWRRYLPES